MIFITIFFTTISFVFYVMLMMLTLKYVTENLLSLKIMTVTYVICITSVILFILYPQCVSNIYAHQFAVTKQLTDIIHLLNCVILLVFVFIPSYVLYCFNRDLYKANKKTLLILIITIIPFLFRIILIDKELLINIKLMPIWYQHIARFIDSYLLEFFIGIALTGLAITIGFVIKIWRKGIRMN